MSIEFLLSVGLFTLLLVALLLLCAVVSHHGKREPFSSSARRERQDRQREFIEAFKRDGFDGGDNSG